MNFQNVLKGLQIIEKYTTKYSDVDWHTSDDTLVVTFCEIPNPQDISALCVLGWYYKEYLYFPGCKFYADVER